MTDDTGIIERILKVPPREGWVVCRYRKLRGLLKLGIRGFFLVLFGGGLLTLLLNRSALSKDTGTLLVLLFMAAAALVSLMLVALQARVLIAGESNRVVLTEMIVARSLGGRVQAWPLGSLSDVLMRHETGHFPHDHVVEIVESDSGRRVDLARHSVFEGVHVLFQEIQKRR